MFIEKTKLLDIAFVYISEIASYYPLFIRVNTSFYYKGYCENIMRQLMDLHFTLSLLCLQAFDEV